MALSEEFKKSSHCGADGNCVQVALRRGGIVVGDTKHPAGAMLAFNENEWNAFVRGVKDGEFDL